MHSSFTAGFIIRRNNGEIVAIFGTRTPDDSAAFFFAQMTLNIAFAFPLIFLPSEMLQSPTLSCSPSPTFEEAQTVFGVRVIA